MIRAPGLIQAYRAKQESLPWSHACANYIPTVASHWALSNQANPQPWGATCTVARIPAYWSTSTSTLILLWSWPRLLSFCPDLGQDRSDRALVLANLSWPRSRRSCPNPGQDRSDLAPLFAKIAPILPALRSCPDLGLILAKIAAVLARSWLRSL